MIKGDRIYAVGSKLILIGSILMIVMMILRITLALSLFPMFFLAIINVIVDPSSLLPLLVLPLYFATAISGIVMYRKPQRSIPLLVLMLSLFLVTALTVPPDYIRDLDYTILLFLAVPPLLYLIGVIIHLFKYIKEFI